MQHELSKMGEELSIAKRLVHVYIYDLFFNVVNGIDLFCNSFAYYGMEG